MLTNKIRIAALIVMLLAGCSPITVKTQFDPSAEFSGLRTYDWMESTVDSGGMRDDSDARLRIQEAVDAQLAAQGYSRDGSDAADFLVVFHGDITKQVNVNTVDRYYGARPGGGWGYGPDSGWRPKRETYVTEYDRGELILDINDPKTRRRMWSGTASAQVRASDSRETQDNRIREAVRRMLAEFPPK